MSGENKKPVYTMAEDMKIDPIDFSENGQCSRRGNCCSSLIPVSPKEIRAIAKYVRKHGITAKLPEGETLIYMHCPFLQPDPERPDRKTCMIYEVRPSICRCFSCHDSNQANARTWTGQNREAPPEPDNIWKIFNHTGLRLNGQDIPYDKAPICRIQTDDHGEYTFQIGRPVSLLLQDGTYVPTSMLIGFDRKGLQIINGANHQPEQVLFKQIAKVLSENNIVKRPDKPERQDAPEHA